MARHTKVKIAALATSFVAALGIVATGPVASAHAGGATQSSYKNWDCC